jgi:hypothetical protein
VAGGGARARRRAGARWATIPRMPTAPELLTASKIAAQLKVTDTKVKKAISEIGLNPAAKKGACSYYAQADVAKIKTALK